MTNRHCQNNSSADIERNLFSIDHELYRAPEDLDQAKMGQIRSLDFSISRRHLNSPFIWTVHLFFSFWKSAPNFFPLFTSPSFSPFSISPGKPSPLLLLLPPLPTLSALKALSQPKKARHAVTLSPSPKVGIGWDLNIIHTTHCALNQCPSSSLTLHSKFYTRSEKFPRTLFPSLLLVHCSSRSELSLQNIVMSIVFLVGFCRLSDQCPSVSLRPHRAFSL